MSPIPTQRLRSLAWRCRTRRKADGGQYSKPATQQGRGRKAETEEFALVFCVDFIAFGFLVGCSAFYTNNDGEAGFSILLLGERVQGGLQYAHGFLV